MAKPPDDLEPKSKPVRQARAAEPETDRAQREEFLALVTCGIQVMMQDAYSRPGLSAERKARALSIYTLSLSDALAAADKIPKGRTASSAALDVLDHVFGLEHSPELDPDRSWLIEIREGRSRKHRAAWAGYEPHSVMKERIARMRRPSKRVDGRMQVERPEWQGLPFDDSVALEALSWVRSEEKIFERQLLQQMQKVDGDVLRSRLKTLEKDGWITSDREPDGAVTYQSTSKLNETCSYGMRKARLPKPTFATPTERYHARTRAARVERIAALHKDPNARKILSAIRRRGPLQLKQIDLIVTGFTQFGLRDFMMHLREGGWVECVGRGGGAAWAATEKLKNAKI